MQETDLNPFFQKLWQGKDPFQAAFELTGESYRKVKSRHTFRVVLENNGYFVKLHRGCGWKEYFKNIFQFKLPVTGANQEYRALHHLKKIGVPTMTPAAYGCKGINPAGLTSFLITEELTDTISLEDYCQDWKENPPESKIKYRLIHALADSAGKMHFSGLNHRDCYICHFLLKKGSEQTNSPALHVIDLHRAQIRKNVPYRYHVKDVAGLWFSAMDAGLTKHDLFRFLRSYYKKELRMILKEESSFLADIDKTARALYRKVHKKQPPV